LARIDENGDRFGALIGAQLRARDRERHGDCPEVETVAAYHERSLAGDERDAVEHHLAGCAACREELAAIARASRESAGVGVKAESGVRRWWTSAPVGFAIAGAIAIVVAVGLGRDYYNQESREQDQQLAMLTAGNRPAAPAEAKSSRATNSAVLKSKKAPVASPAAVAAPPVGGAAIRSMPPARAPSPLSAPSSPNAPLIAKSTRNLNAFSERAAAETAPARAAAPASLPERRMVQSMGAPSSAISAQGPAAPAMVPESASGGATGLSIAQNQSPTFARPWPHTTVTSPDGSVRWEFGSGGTIQRFGPGGMTAIRVPGVTADLLAGSAPSSTVCWIVGQGGVVLRTIDGSDWEKVNSPTSRDLIAVTASGPDDAVATARDSRRYATSDGGQTWQPQ
jgi:hypothetical protein